MTVLPYFAFDLPMSARGWRDCNLPLHLEGEEHPTPLYPLRRIAAALQQNDPAAGASAGELALLTVLCNAWRLIIDQALPPQPAAETCDRACHALLELYPPLTPTGAQRHRRELIELFVLAVLNENRATEKYTPLYADDDLAARCDYRHLLTEIDQGSPLPAALSDKGSSLLELLRRPLRAAPDSLSRQLAYLQQHWRQHLPAHLFTSLDLALAARGEETQLRGGGPGPAPVFQAGDAASVSEPERFSPDSRWMPNVVLIAKTIYVWLDQLSRRFDRPIQRLDEIPEEALDELVGWGFTSLWLIGIWERSQASQSIKQRMGNPEAAASAYSLFDYQVAADLGGDAALDTLQQRCETLGLRLACDVVPNHTGIDSRWMREHPDWFLQSAHPPYPDYHFDGPDLSNDPAFGLFIEDGYWQRRNAAVVFKHLDRTNGQVRYIYHGNDGTHLPWNDTAQLNFLLPQVREAMIETILHVARRFRVIRFDAAMTLARKHYQRLWFPLPGASGVPSRAEQTISQERFAELFPQEFWREVVDRVAQEVPDTLLLAEAFWLMEGYFVRTLGMHRVYNSAFMNMLKNEENGRYHETLRNILAANPQILKRFVNFMNNPDEETAVAQFGKSEKYFGVATLLATMPGLPMFGHGQIEGFEEKYGMEYRRAYRDETPDAEFIAEHARRIFPLLRRRDLFSDVEQFTLYEARQSSGSPLEDLFAYSNRHGEERALILYHNRQGNVSGRIEPHSLGFPIEENHYLRCRELVSGRDYLFATTELQRDGFLFRLGPYQAAVYLDWQLLIDHDGSWGELCTELGGHGCDDLDRARLRQQSRPLIEPLLALLDAENLALILDALAQGVLSEALLDGAERFYTPLQQRHGRPVGELGRQLQNDLETLLKLQTLSGRNPQERRLLARLNLTSRLTDPQQLRLLVIWLLLRPLEQLAPGINGFDLYPLQEALATRLEEPESELPLMRLLWRHPNLFAPGHSLPGSLKRVLRDPFGARYLRIHPHDGRTWFDRERFETLLPYLALIATFSALDFFGSEEKEFMLHLQQCQTYLDALPSEAEKAGYNLDKFQARLW